MVEIVDLPINSMVIFHRKVLVYQAGYPFSDLQATSLQWIALAAFRTRAVPAPVRAAAAVLFLGLSGRKK